MIEVENRGQHLMKTINEGIIQQDRSGKIIFANPSALNLFGLTQTEIEGTIHGVRAWKAWNEEGIELSREQLPSAQTLRSGKASIPQTIGIQIGQDSRKWILVTATPIFDPHHETELMGVYSTFVDVTEDRKRKIEHEEQRLGLIKASRLTALGEMASGVAHEINNPLMIIRSWATKLQEAKTPSFDEVQKASSKILSMADRIAKIVSNMRSLTWDASNEAPSEFTLGSMIQTVLDICQERIEKSGTELRVSCETEAKIQGRPVQLSQVLVNLTQNAWHAVQDQPHAWVEVSAYVKNDQLTMKVRDSGKGIPPEIREKIMQPFFTTKDPGKGTGLGLSISRELIAKNGGKLWIDERDPHTTFVIELPLKALSTVPVLKAA
jgi:PAS domain S-box-containing protein